MALTEIPLELSSTPSIVDNGNATAITIDSSENVGVGVAPIGTGLNIKANGNGYTDGALSLTDTDSDTRTYLTHVNNTFAVSMNDGAGDGIIMSSAGAVTIANGLTLTDGNVVVANGHGIDFSANAHVSGMTSELLNDYEEGAWTPVIKAIGAGGNTATATMSAPTYTKVGRLVNVVVYISGININTITAGTYITLQGFPFTATNYADFTIAYKSGDWSTSGNIIGGYLQSGASYAFFMRANGNEALQTSTDVTMTTAMINITYQAS